MVALALMLYAWSWAPTPCASELRVTARIQQGPACALAASAMALDVFGAQVDPMVLAREVPYHVDGVSFFDLQEALGPRGFASWTFPKAMPPWPRASSTRACRSSPRFDAPRANTR